MTRPQRAARASCIVMALALVAACGDSAPAGAVATLTEVATDAATAGAVDAVRRDLSPPPTDAGAPIDVAEDMEPNEAPIAVAGDDISALAGLPLRFDGSGSYDPDGQIVAWTWQLGNGVELEGEAVDYTYPESGVYTVTLTVEDNLGATASDTLTVDLDEDNEAPVAVISGPFEVVLGETNRWDGRGSDDDVAIIDWRWSTGVVDEPELLGQAIEYAYQEWESRPYRLELTVVDTDEVEAIDVIEVDVLAPPVGVVTGPNEAFVGDEVIFDATESYDPDDDSPGALDAIQWAFGDGVTTGETPFFPIHTRPTHVYEEPGRYDVVATVRDTDAIWRDSPSHKIDIFARPNLAPSPIIDAGAFSVDECETLRFTGVLTVDDTDSVDDLDFFWDFGDGSGLAGVEVDHAFEREGVYEVELRAVDTEGLTGRTSVFVTVTNLPPTAVFSSDPSPGIVDTSTNFDASASSDACVGTITRYRWDFGDGTLGTPSDSPVRSHTYSSPGTYEVRLTVEDDGDPALEGSVVGRVTVIPGGDDGVDYSGFYDVEPDVDYSCYFGLAAYGASSFTFIDSGVALVVNGFTRGLLSTESVPLSGEISDEGEFFATATLTGACDEDFTLTGAFSDIDNWSGVFEIDFRPAGCAGDCAYQRFEVTGAPR